MLSLMTCCYLLFRQSNAIAPDITSPIRLRRWTSAFFASITLSHLWYMPEFYLTSAKDTLLCNLIGATLDFMTLVPLGIVVLLSMLQNRRRPLWPVCLMVAPLAVITLLCAATCSIALLPILYAYYLLLGIGILLYMVREVRQYSRWLRDNYADLEHKELWQSIVVLAVILLFFGIYTLEPYYRAVKYIMQLNIIILVCYLLWRVETLSDLSISAGNSEEETDITENVDDNELPLSIRNNIGLLLKEYCEEPQLYLQHDISATQLAKQIGTNRVYLSKHFALQGITYNAYINGLRIQHFINLYKEAVTSHKPILAKQLAYQSGFRSYSTFSAAFKQIMGMTATEWMRSTAE